MSKGTLPTSGCGDAGGGAATGLSSQADRLRRSRGPPRRLGRRRAPGMERQGWFGGTGLAAPRAAAGPPVGDVGAAWLGGRRLGVGHCWGPEEGMKEVPEPNMSAVCLTLAPGGWDPKGSSLESVPVTRQKAR